MTGPCCWPDGVTDCWVLSVGDCLVVVDDPAQIPEHVQHMAASWPGQTITVAKADRFPSPVSGVDRNPPSSAVPPPTQDPQR